MKKIVYSTLTVGLVIIIITFAIIPTDRLFEIWDSFSETQRIFVLILLGIFGIPWFIWIRKIIHDYENKKNRNYPQK